MGRGRKRSIALLIVVVNLIVLSSISSACGNKCRAPPKHPTPRSRKEGRCKNALKFGVCGALVMGGSNFTVGEPPKAKCCTVMTGMINLEAAVCICTALKANILGAKLQIPIAFSYLLSACSKKVPDNFKCP